MILKQRLGERASAHASHSSVSQTTSLPPSLPPSLTNGIDTPPLRLGGNLQLELRDQDLARVTLDDLGLVREEDMDRKVRGREGGRAGGREGGREEV